MNEYKVQCGRCGRSFPLVEGEIQKHACRSPRDLFAEEFENLKKYIGRVEEVVASISIDDLHPSWQMARRLTTSSRDELARGLVALQNPKEV